MTKELQDNALRTTLNTPIEDRFSATTKLKHREIDSIIRTITQLEAKTLIRNFNGQIELAGPSVLADTASKIAVLLQQVVDPLALIEREFRQTKAQRFDTFLKQGIKKSPALDSLKMEPDLIDMEIAVNRIQAFVKRTEQSITTTQSNMRVKTGVANGNF